MKIELKTSLPEEECRKLIEKTQAKDKMEAQRLLQALEDPKKLPALKRKMAGTIVGAFIKMIPGEEKRQLLIAEFRERAEYGTESFVSYISGVLTIEVPDSVIYGADNFSALSGGAIDMRKRGEKELLRRFKASKLTYLEDENNGLLNAQA